MGFGATAQTPDAASAASERLAQAPAAPGGASPLPQQADVPPPPRFDIERFDVQGNTLLPATDIQDAVAPYTGKSKDFADVQRALESLQNRYQRRGFGSVQVMLPEQELERGVIVLRVIEPRLNKVTLEGNKFFDEANVRRSLPALKEGETPNAGEIARGARLANENPAKRTTVLLRAGSNEGEIDATVRVQDEKFWRAAVSLDNTGSPTTGMYRLGFGYQHSNLFNLDHTLTMQYQLDPEPLRDWDELKILGAAYRIPFYSRGASLDLIAAYSSIGAISGQVFQGQSFNLAGSGTMFGVRYNQLLPRLAWLDDYEHRLIFGFDYKAFTNQVVNTQFGFNETPDVTVYPLSIGYSATKRSDNAEFSFFAQVSQNVYPHGPDAFKERFTDPAPPLGEGAARGVGDPYYRLWRYGLNYVRGFTNDFQFRANMVGQWTRDALVPGEQFGLGGWESVRGMLERESANDRGYRVSLEVYSPELSRAFQLESAKLRLLAFFDWGSLRQNHSDPAFCVGTTNCRLTASSLGVGMRMSLRQGVNVRLDFAEMLDGGAISEQGRHRLHGAVNITF